MSHPIHPALVHFPIACWILGTFADIASLQFGLEVERIATVLIIAGVVIAVPTMLTGLLDLNRIERGSEAQDVVMKHITYVFSAWILYAATLYVRININSNLSLMPEISSQLIKLAFSIGGFFAISLAGWYGGKLVYEHGVGMQKT